MPDCELLDFRCVFVNELAGDPILASVLVMVGYFIVASRMRWGFDTTITFLFPILLMFGLAINGFSTIYTFTTLLVGLLVAWVFHRIIGIR